jgi:uncharacterized delta-60 repeat protein
MLLLPLRRSFVILTALVCAWVGPILKAQSAADGFNPTVGGSVNAIVVQPDSKSIIGGIFTTLQPNGAPTATPVNSLARLNVDGTIDATYAMPAFSSSTGVNAGNVALGAQINVLALQDDGKLLVGGNFGVNGQNFLARLNANGSLDATFAPQLTGNINGAVTAVTYVPGATVGTGQILIGGNFTSIKTGTAAAFTRNHVARLNYNGTVDPTWNPNVSAQVDAFAYQPKDGSVIIAGAFTTVNPTTVANPTPATVPPIRNYIARILVDGSLDLTYDPNANNQVAAVVLQLDGKLLIAGSFTQLSPPQSDGTTVDDPVGFIARLNTDGSLDTTFTTSASANISAMILEPNGNILLGGTIGTITDYTATTEAVSNVAQLSSSGALDLFFTPNLNQPATALAVQPDGKLLVGGIFTQVRSVNAPNFVSRMGIARLDPFGILDTDFNPGAFGGIGVIVVDGSGDYLVGGAFTTIDGVTVRNFARLLPSGALDTTFFKSNPDQPVSAIALQSNGQIIIGGLFGHITSNSTSGDVTSDFLARLNPDGTQDTSYNPEPSGAVLAVVLQSTGQALVGGNFSEFTHNGTDAPVAVSDLARVNLDGTLDLSFQPNPAGTVHSIVLDGTSGAVIAGGEFASQTPAFNGITTSIQFLARFSLANGTVDTTWTPTPDNFVTSVVRQSNGQFVYGGVFLNVTNEGAPLSTITGLPIETPRQYLARCNADGSNDTSFNPDPDNFVQKVALDTNQNILVGGLFKNINGQNQPYLARLLPGGELDPSMAARPNAVVDAVTPLTGGGFLAGGAFTTMLLPGATTAVSANHLARFLPSGAYDGSLNLVGTVGGTINALALDSNGELLLAGSFANIDGVFAANIARFFNDGSFDNGFGPNPNGPVYSMVVESNGNSIYVGGSYSTISGGVSQNLARINTNATLDTTFNAYPQGAVYAMATQSNGQLVIAGSFNAIQSIFTTNNVPVPVTNLARVSGSNGAIDTSFSPAINGTVDAVALQPNGKILIGGTFTTVSGTPCANLARINADGSFDATFAPGVAGGVVNAITVQPDGLILIGGSFTTVGGVAQSYLARLTAAGALDPTLNLVPNAAVNAIVLENTGVGNDSIVFGGSFTAISGTTRNHMARLLAPNSSSVILDPAYNPNVDNSPGTGINTVAFSFDGKSYLGGSFSNVGGLPRVGIARLSATAGSSTTITTNSKFNEFTWTLAGQVPDITDIVFEVSSDGVNFTTLGAATRVGTSNSWTIADTPAVPSGDIFILALADAVTTEYGSQSEFATVQHFYGTPISTVQSALAPTAVVGVPFYYEVAATNSPTSVTAPSLPPGLTLNPALGIISGTPTVAGTYAINLTIVNGNASPVMVTITLTVNPSPAAADTTGRLINISTEATVSLTTDLESGFTITGTSPKTVLLRAVGPALAQFGVALPLDQPHLTLYNSSAQAILTAQGSDTSPSGSAAIAQITASVGAFPLTAGSPDTTVVTVLQPGPYTIHVTSGDGSTGTTLAEVYDADQNVYATPSVLSNISSHATVDSTDPVYAGFVIGGNSPREMLIRGVGPGLDAFGLAGLADPILNVYEASGTLVATNHQFQTPITSNADYPAASAAAINAAITATGAFALTPGSEDTAVLLALAPGAYTATVISASGSTGVVQLEAYDDGAP